MSAYWMLFLISYNYSIFVIFQGVRRESIFLAAVSPFKYVLMEYE